MWVNGNMVFVTACMLDLSCEVHILEPTPPPQKKKSHQ